MGKFRLHDWNDIRLLIACAEKGGFAGAALSLGIDQSTVSRRIGLLEEAVGRPLFNRRRSGATPTAAGLALIERARSARQTVADFESALSGLGGLPPPMVTVGASDGLLAYTLIPVLLKSSATPQPIDGGVIRHQLPSLAFTTSLDRADIAIAATATDQVPEVGGAMRVRRVGTMHFKPVAGQCLLQAEARAIDSFDELVSWPVLDVAIYRPLRSLDGWNAVVSQSSGGHVTVTPTSHLMHKALVEGKGVGILPSYSPLYDERIVVLDVEAPQLDVSLWLVAHEDRLREPAVRQLYDSLGEMFVKSPWFSSRRV